MTAPDRCARHPEMSSARACASCGVTMCASCWTHDVRGEPTCAPCVAHLRERSPVALPSVMSAYLVVVIELVIRGFVQDETGATAIRVAAYFVTGVAAMFLYAKIRGRRVDALVTDRDPEAAVPSTAPLPTPAGPFRTSARVGPDRMLDLLEVSVTPPVSGDVASLLALGALGVALVGAPVLSGGGALPRMLIASLTCAVPLALGLAWVFYRGARVADDHVFQAEKRDFETARDAPYSPWNLPGVVFAIVGVMGPQGLVIGAIVACLVGLLITLGFVIGEVLVPLAFLAAYLYFQAALRFAANHPHGARGSVAKSLALGLGYGALFTIPCAGVAAGVFALLPS